MKYLTHLITIVLLVSMASCKKDADKPSNTCPITPPSWIQGTWVDQIGGVKWVFTNNNAVYTGFGIVFDQCLINSGPATIEEETETSTSYSLKTTTGGPSPFQTFYSFQKISATKIIHCTNQLPCGSFPLPPLELFKQ